MAALYRSECESEFKSALLVKYVYTYKEFGSGFP